MNYLAHFHLAWPEPGLIAGALEGDYRKGRLRGELPDSIERGVRLHRAVDAFTDDHPDIARLRQAFPSGLRRYAGIVIDISFDHFLARHWARYSPVDRQTFNQAVYATLRDAHGELSAPAQRMSLRMAQIDLLDHYFQWETVSASAERVGARLKRGNPFLGMEPQLQPLREPLEQCFVDFYPELVTFARAFRAA